MSFSKTIVTFLTLASLSGVLASKQIHPAGNKDDCLGVFTPQNDAQIAVVSCTAPRGARIDWDVVLGDNLSVRLSGTNFCLDAGATPKNGVLAKVYTCYPGASQQHWFLTNDNRIAITGGNQCLDRQNGISVTQTWQCSPGNANQVFTTTDSTPPPVDSTCFEGQQRIAFPAPGANITALAAANGGLFRFQYCSAQYFRASTRDIKVVLSTEAFGGVGGRILAEQVANNGFTYTLNLTATNPSGVSQDHGKYILEVLETYNGYYIGLSVTREAINVLV